MCLGVRPHLDATFNFCRMKCFTARLRHRLCNAPDECVCGGRGIGVGVPPPPPVLPSLFSLSFPPHRGDTTVPSALHLFNKDLLCSETLIQSVCTQAETHTSHLFFFFFFSFSSQAAKEKKSEGCGIGNALRALCQLSLQQGGRAGWHAQAGTPITASSASVTHSHAPTQVQL